MSLDIEIWNKGITDNYLNGAPGAARKLDNLLINEDKKLVQRPALTILNSVAPQIPPGNQQIDALYFFDSTWFIKSGTKLYTMADGGAMTALAGPTGNDAFADSELTAKCSWSEWRGHLIITPGPSANRKGGCRTVKVYRNAAGTWTLVQAGLPDMKKAYGPIVFPQAIVDALAAYDVTVLYKYAQLFVREYVALVNGVSTVFKDYGAPNVFAFQSPYLPGDGVTINYQAPGYVNTAYENFDTTNMRSELFRTVYDGKELRYVASAKLIDNTTATSSITVTVSTSGASGILRVATDDLRLLYVNQKLILDDNDSPAIDVYVIAKATNGDVTLSLTRGGAAANVSAYTTAQTAVLKYVPHNDSTLDADLGTEQKVVTITSSASAASGVFSVDATDIAYFYENQKVSIDDSNSTEIDVWVIAVSYTAYTVTFSKTRGGAASDLSAYTTAQTATLTFGYQSKIPAGYDFANYNDPCPPCYFSAIADSYGWYVAPIDMASGQHRAARFAQSKPGDVDAVPSGNYGTVPAVTTTAVGVVGQYPVVFTRNSCHRIEGRIDAFGNGVLRAILISKVEGAVSQDITCTQTGIFFPSENGFCWTDGFRVINLSKKHLKATYKALLNKDKMVSCFDAEAARVYFGLESAALSPTVSGNNNAAFVLDMAQTENMEEGVFTTASAAANLQPTAMHYDSVNGRIAIGDKRGYIFKFDATLTADPIVNTAAAYSTWNYAAVVWDYIMPAFAFGSTAISKWMGSVKVVCDNLTGNLSIGFSVFKDKRTTAVPMKSARDRSITNGVHKIERAYPKTALSCIYSGLRMTKDYCVILKSDDYALATTSGAGNTAALVSGSWANDGSYNLVGHFLWLAPYSAGYEISAQSGGTLTVLDPGNTFPTNLAGVKWVVMGYPKNESVRFESVSIDAQLMGEGYPERSDQGGNA